MTTAFPVDATTRLRRTPEVLTATVGHELLMMHVETGSYFALSPVTARIWDLLESPAGVAEVIARLIAEYEVDPDTCRSEVLHVLQGLADAGVVQPDGA